MHQFQKRVGPTRRHLLTGFAAVAAAILLTAVLGIWEHVASNYEAGELDFEYANRWESLTEPARWWLAATKIVGPSPPLAPGALAQASVCVLLATLRHPTLHRRESTDPTSPGSAE